MSVAVSEEDEKWEWLCPPPLAGTATLEELLRNNSLFRKVAMENNSYVYVNDKSLASTYGSYYVDGKDRSTDNVGSIICWEVAELVRGKKIRSIISISTYGIRFYEEDASEEDIRELYVEIIKGIVLEQFEKELSEALILYTLVKDSYSNK